MASEDHSAPSLREAEMRAFLEHLETTVRRAALSRWCVPPPDKNGLYHGLFRRLENKRALVGMWNDGFKLGFTPDDFADLDMQIAGTVWPRVEPFVNAIIVPYLPDKDGTPGYIRTIEFLWARAREQQEKSWQSPSFGTNLSERTVRLLGGSERYRPGLKVELIDLGANWDKERGIEPASVRSPESSPHAGVLAAAAEDVAWLQAMDFYNVPYVWVPGLECGAMEKNSVWWGEVPRIQFYLAGRGLELNVHFSTYATKYHSVPVFVRP